jgi:hypothetical protein
VVLNRFNVSLTPYIRCWQFGYFPSQVAGGLLFFDPGMKFFPIYKSELTGEATALTGPVNLGWLGDEGEGRKTFNCLSFSF